jgi:indole-3-glycerol phosphate synthase
MNAGAALYVSGAAESIQDGVELSSEAIKSGRALEKLSEIVKSTREREAERQLLMQPSSLRSRRILPEVLRARAPELAKFLTDEIASMDGGGIGLDGLDPELLSSPNALSVISLSRLMSVLSKGVPESSSNRVSQRSFSDAISRQGLAVIGEYKPRSPSHDGAYVSPDPLTVAEQYARAGVSAMSVLVEDEFFGGGPELFSAVRERTALPLLFKDFVVTEEQLRMAKAVGADAVLLIAKALREETLDAFIASSLEKGMEPVVELHDYADIKKFMSCPNAGNVRVVGLNSRDLRTLATDKSKLNKLRCRLPSDKLVIAESGVRDGADVRSLRGFDAVLVGSVLMESDDLLGKAEELVNAGRSVLS